MIPTVYALNKTRFDIIGDVHGHLELLTGLLSLLGYQDRDGCWYHPEGRKAVFLGDLINRGPDSIGVLRLVQEMNNKGEAFISIGNHEFRILQEFVKSGSLENKELLPFLGWIRSWPLFLEFPGFRAVHAAWHFSSIKALSEASLASDDFIRSTLENGSEIQRSTQNILYGIRVHLPKEQEMKDRFGIARKKGRIKWWQDPAGKSFSEYLLSPMYPAPSDLFPEAKEVEGVEPYQEPELPVFFGHYCLPPDIPKVNGQTVCLDGCVTCDKKLWAYSWNGESSPTSSNLIHFPRNPISTEN